MATATTDGGSTRTSGLSGKENAKPSFTSKLKKLAAATPGIIGSSIVEGIGGPKARGAKVAVEGAEKIAPAVVRFAQRTGAKILADRKGAQILAEKAAAENKVSKVAARRVAEEAAGPKARRLGGEKVLKGTAPKPDVRITTKSGKYRGYGTLSKEATTVTKPVSRTLNKRSAVTITKTEPKGSKNVVSDRLKAQRDRTREALTIKVNPARPKIAAKRGGLELKVNKADVIDKDARQLKSIDARVDQGVEKATSKSKSYARDPEQNTADRMVDEALNPKSRLKATVKPGKPTKTTVLLRTVGGKPGSKTAALKGAIRNQRKVIEGRKLRTAAGTKSVNAIKAEEVKKSGSWKNGKAK